MKQLTINPSNKLYYSEDFIKGFKCGAERQFEADKADRLIKESDVLKAIDKRIKELSKHPEADRPQGEWIEQEDDYHHFTGYRCSNCNYWKGMRVWNFCPNCGADMKGADDD